MIATLTGLATWTALVAIVCLAIVGLADVVTWVLVAIERHAKAVRTPWPEPVDRLVDGDDWARVNGYDDDWRLFPAPEFAETPIYAQLRHEGDVLFAAEVLATIDELPGGAA